jgi:hypothetical protein
MIRYAYRFMMEKYRNVVACHEEVIDEVKDDLGNCFCLFTL